MRKEIASFMKKGLFLTFSLFKEENKLLSIPGGLEITLDSVIRTDYIQRNINYMWTAIKQKALTLLLFLS